MKRQCILFLLVLITGIGYSIANEQTLQNVLLTTSDHVTFSIAESTLKKIGFFDSKLNFKREQGSHQNTQSQLFADVSLKTIQPLLTLLDYEEDTTAINAYAEQLYSEKNSLKKMHSLWHLLKTINYLQINNPEKIEAALIDQIKNTVLTFDKNEALSLLDALQRQPEFSIFREQIRRSFAQSYHHKPVSLCVLKTRPINLATLKNLQFSPDGSLLAIHSLNNVKVYKISSGFHLFSVLRDNRDGHLTDIQTAFFSPDSSLLITHSLDKVIAHNTSDGSCKFSVSKNNYNGHLQEILDCSFNSNGSCFFTQSYDKVIVYTTFDFTPVLSIRKGDRNGHVSDIHCAYFSSDDNDDDVKLIITHSQDKSVYYNILDGTHYFTGECKLPFGVLKHLSRKNFKYGEIVDDFPIRIVTDSMIFTYCLNGHIFTIYSYKRDCSEDIVRSPDLSLSNIYQAVFAQRQGLDYPTLTMQRNLKKDARTVTITPKFNDKKESHDDEDQSIITRIAHALSRLSNLAFLDTI